MRRSSITSSGNSTSSRCQAPSKSARPAQFSYLNDFGPTSIDGWLGRLVGGELGLASSVLDLAARELVIDGKRTPLTKLEFALMQHLILNEGHAVCSRAAPRRGLGLRRIRRQQRRRCRCARASQEARSHAGCIETVSGVGYRYRPVIDAAPSARARIRCSDHAATEHARERRGLHPHHFLITSSPQRAFERLRCSYRKAHCNQEGASTCTSRS